MCSPVNRPVGEDSPAEGTAGHTPEERRRWIEALHEQNLEQEKLFQLIASLANLLDREIVVETIRSILGIEPVHKGDCVLFDNLSMKFDDRGKIIGVYRTIDSADVLGRDK